MKGGFRGQERSQSASGATPRDEAQIFFREPLHRSEIIDSYRGDRGSAVLASREPLLLQDPEWCRRSPKIQDVLDFDRFCGTFLGAETAGDATLVREVGCWRRPDRGLSRL